MRERIGHEPLGVVANISAWNYPYFVGGNVFVPALLDRQRGALQAVGVRHADRPAHRRGCCTRPGVPADVFITVVGARRGRRGAARAARRRRLLHRLGTPPARRSPQAVGPRMVRLQLELGGKDPTYVADDVDVEGRRRVARRRRDVQHRPELLLGRAHLRPRAASTTPSSTPSSRRCRASRSAIRRADGTYIGPLTRAPQLDGARSAGRPTRWPRARRSSPAASASRAPGNWFEPTVLTDVDHTMAVMRDESFGPIIGIQKVRDDDEALALMNDTALRPHRRRVHARRGARARSCCAQRQRRQRLLELLRPRQPAPALVGPRPLGHRRHAVDLRHPGLHAAEGLAPALGLSAEVRQRRVAAAGAVRSRRHAARRRHRRALVRVPDRRGRPRPRDFAAAQPGRRRALSQRGEITPAEFAAFYAATLAGRSPPAVGAAARALRARASIAPRIGAAVARAGRAASRALATGSS